MTKKLNYTDWGWWSVRALIIYRLKDGHFHIGLVTIPRPPYWPETESRANMG